MRSAREEETRILPQLTLVVHAVSTRASRKVSKQRCSTVYFVNLRHESAMNVLLSSKLVHLATLPLLAPDLLSLMIDGQHKRTMLMHGVQSVSLAKASRDEGVGMMQTWPFAAVVDGVELWRNLVEAWC